MNKAVRSQCLITGVYRSGTEFVAQLLSGHPELSTSMYHVNGIRFLRGRYEPLSVCANARAAVAETSSRLLSRYDMRLDAERTLAIFDQSRSKDSYALYDAIMRVLWESDKKQHWAEKCQLVWREIPEFVTCMPNGKTILVLRDPRSTLASFKHYTYASSPAYLGAIFNCLDAFAWALEYQSSLPSDRFVVVRYEDAAREPAETAANLFTFLGLDPSPASFDREHWRNEKGEKWTDNTAFGTFDVEQAIERWRGVLNGLEVALTESVCGPVMSRFGYEPSNAQLDWPAALKLCLSDPQIAECLRLWLVEGRGIQAFPTDPLRPENWEENAKAATQNNVS